MFRRPPKSTRPGTPFPSLALFRSEWRTEETDTGTRLGLVWTESGGPPVSPPAHRGFGLRMVDRGLAHEFRGVVEIKFQPQGLICTIYSSLEGGAAGSADGCNERVNVGSTCLSRESERARCRG